MSDQRQRAIASNRRKRLHERAATKQAESRPEQVAPDKGPRVTNYKPEAPPWADPNWRPAATGPAVSESLEAYRRAQEWAALRERFGRGGGYDDMGNRNYCPPGFDPITGHKL